METPTGTEASSQQPMRYPDLLRVTRQELRSGGPSPGLAPAPTPAPAQPQPQPQWALYGLQPQITFDWSLVIQPEPETAQETTPESTSQKIKEIIHRYTVVARSC